MRLVFPIDLQLILDHPFLKTVTLLVLFLRNEPRGVPLPLENDLIARLYIGVVIRRGVKPPWGDNLRKHRRLLGQRLVGQHGAAEH